VLHVVADLGAGGVERLLLKSLDVLDRKNFTHQVCCISGGGIYENELRSSGIACWTMNRRFRFDPTVVFQMASLMRRERIDVVHTLNFTANAWGRVAAILAGVPRLIAHERGTAWSENGPMRWVDRSLYPFTHLWLANSRASKIVLTQHVGIPEDRIRVVYNGLSETSGSNADRTSLRQRLGIGPGVPLIGCVGRLDTPKGHTFLLRAMPGVWRKIPEARVVFIGDGPLRGFLDTEAQRLDHMKNRNLHFLGFVPNAFDLMPDMDLLVQPSIRESLGNVFIEAGLSRLPVVASNVDGCPEVVVEGTTGILVDCTIPVEYVDAPGAAPLPAVAVDGRTLALRPPLGPDPEALAEAIIGLLLDPHLRRRMGEQARERALRLFSLETYVRNLESAYRGDL
jgi:glycosyltransferase involved in cell wall biosynthesis